MIHQFGKYDLRARTN